MDARLKKMPQDLLSELASYGSPAQRKLLFDAFLKPRPETFRINTLRTSEAHVTQSLKKSKIPFSPSPHLPLCYFFGDVSQKKIRSHDLFTSGALYLQNSASQVPALLLDPQPGDKIVDLCASPGGKTSHLAALMNNVGTLHAVEPDKIRYERLVHNLNHLGVKAETHHLSAEKFLRAAGPDCFDKILIDAPCSGSGTFQINRPQDYYHWNLDFVKKLSVIQSRILEAAARSIRLGGTMVYSTCSLSQDENEAVVINFLEHHPNFTTVEMEKVRGIQLKQFASMPFIPSNTPDHLARLVAKTRRIFPGKIFEGFYLAKLIRIS